MGLQTIRRQAPLVTQPYAGPVTANTRLSNANSQCFGDSR